MHVLFVSWGAIMFLLAHIDKGSFRFYTHGETASDIIVINLYLFGDTRSFQKWFAMYSLHNNKSIMIRINVDTLPSRQYYSFSLIRTILPWMEFPFSIKQFAFANATRAFSFTLLCQHFPCSWNLINSILKNIYIFRCCFLVIYW